MPTSQKFSVNKFLDQKGVFPIILIIILTVVIAGVAGVVYQSRKEIKVRSDKTSEVTELKGTPAPTPKKEEVSLANSGRLADKPFKQSLSKEATDSSVPKFSIYPPAGWDKLTSDGNYAVEFLSPAGDKITEGAAWLNFQPGIVVSIEKAEFKNLEEAVEVTIRESGSSISINQKQKVKVNGEQAYAIESVMDIRDIAQKILESQIQQEIAKAGKEGKTVSQDEVRTDMEKVLKQAKTKGLIYIFYKNGYHVTASGRALESFWDKRSQQIKGSLDTFKFE